MSTAVPVTGQPSPRAVQGHPSITLAVIVSFMLLIGIDSTVVNTALPHVETALGFTNATLSWVLNAYTLAFGGLLLLGGRLGDVFGRRNVFLVGVIVFTVASLLAGLATTSEWLLAARAGQGVGAALAAPSTMALIATNFEGDARARALSIFSAVMGAGASAGLVVGGLFTDFVTWRLVFFINVPLGVAIAILAPRLIKQPQTHKAGFDIPGALTSTLGMVALVYAFIRVSSNGWGDTLAISMFAVAVVLLAVFVIIETRVSDPITPLHLLTKASRANGYVMTLFLTAAMFSVLFLLTQFLQDVRGFSPLLAGLAFLPMTMMQFAAVRLVPKLLPKVGARPLLLAGTVSITAGMFWLTQLTSGSGYWAMNFGPLFLIGLGVGICFPTLNITILSGVAPQDSGAASGMLQATQWLGGTLGLSIFVTVLGIATHHAAANGVGASHAQLAHGIATAYIAAAISAALAIVLSLFAPGKPKPQPVPAMTDTDTEAAPATPSR